MKMMAKLGLKILCTLFPVTIAACYGAPADFQKMKCANVIDAQTQQPIVGIEVTCMNVTTELGKELTSANGDICFQFDGEAVCETFVVKDVDGTSNGGIYQPQTVPIDAGQTNTMVALAH